jgi:3-deoxy-D-manno-octulosonic-acid transferase
VSRTLPLALYGLATALLEPFAPMVLRGRARRGKEDAGRIGERLGHASTARPAGPLYWLHGVSVGEAASLLPLVAALRRARPKASLLVTSGTVTAAAMLAKRLPDGVLHQFASVDTPGAVRRFLDHWRPDLGVLVESELWPNLILHARARGVRLALVSARMTDASARRWASWSGSAKTLLDAFDVILPQDEATAGRLRVLGATPGGQLNLKRMADPLPADPEELARLRAAAGGRRVVLAASTHPGEEARIAEAFRAAVPDPDEALLIIAPRHPDRGAAVAAELGATRRSLGEAPGGPIHLADTLGELGLFFRLADVVVMGGSFEPGIGGHNPLEPARLGRPILTGALVANSAALYDELVAETGAIRVQSPGELSRHLRGLLDHPAIARRMGEAALSYAERQAGPLDQAVALLVGPA